MNPIFTPFLGLLLTPLVGWAAIAATQAFWARHQHQQDAWAQEWAAIEQWLNAIRNTR